MISTRIRRGAVRTHVLIRNKIEIYSNSQVKRSISLARSLALTAVAARMVFLPVPVVPTAHAAALPDMPADSVSEPPSTFPGDGDVSSKVYAGVAFDASANDTGDQLVPFSYDESDLTGIEIGKSADTIKQEEDAKRQAEEDAKAELAKKAAAKKRAVSAAPAVAVTGDVQQFVHDQVVAAFGEAGWPAMAAIISRESGFNPNSYNTHSGACGLFQALPCSKMGGTEVSNQVAWGIRYIQNRYGTPQNAWAFWQLHHWY